MLFLFFAFAYRRELVLYIDARAHAVARAIAERLFASGRGRRGA